MYLFWWYFQDIEVLYHLQTLFNWIEKICSFAQNHMFYIYKICCCYWAAEHRQSHVENWKHFKWLRWTIRQKHVENHLMLVSFQFTNITMSLTSPRWTCQSIKVILRTETRGGVHTKTPNKIEIMFSSHAEKSRCTFFNKFELLCDTFKGSLAGEFLFILNLFLFMCLNVFLYRKINNKV